jgi:hypothetical protein
MIVQALTGNKGWCSMSQSGRLYHVGTIPNLKGNIYAADLRVMIRSSPQGFFPVAIYARQARLPLAEKLDASTSSWDMLGTNPVIQGDLLIPKAYLVKWSLANGTTFLVQRRIPLNAIHGRFQFLSFIF